MLDSKIEKAEAAIAMVQVAVAAHDSALDARRRQSLDMLPLRDRMKKEAAHNEAALKQIEVTHAETLRVLRLDAEERGIPNNDH